MHGADLKWRRHGIIIPVIVVYENLNGRTLLH